MDMETRAAASGLAELGTDLAAAVRGRSLHRATIPQLQHRKGAKTIDAYI